MLATETIATRGAQEGCQDCGEVPIPTLLHSAGGHFVGTRCVCPGVFTRETDYHPSAGHAARALVRGALGELAPEERMVLVARLGLDGGARYRTPTQVARLAGTSPGWADLIGERARGQLRQGVCAALVQACEDHPAARAEARAILEGSAEPLSRAGARRVWREGARWGSPVTVPMGMVRVPDAPVLRRFGAEAAGPPARGLSLIQSPGSSPGPTLGPA